MAMTLPERSSDAPPSRPRCAAWWLIAHPAWWAWPAAALLTGGAPTDSDLAALAVRHYYLPALLLVLVGCVPSLRGIATRTVRPRPTLLPRAVLVSLTVAILTGAVIFRLWRLAEWPPQGIGFEEYELGARAMLAGGPLDKLVTIYATPHEHALTAYAVSLSFGFFGTGFFELRLPFVVGGLLTPFLFYAVCRRLVAWEPALFALSLFAVSWWQIAASRPADEIFFPLWAELAVLALLLRFEDTAESWAAFALALFSGLLIYEYSAYHLVMPLVIGYCAVRVVCVAVRTLRAPAPWAERRHRLANAARAYAPGAAAMLLVWTILARLQLLGDLSRGNGWWLLEGIRRHGTDGILGRLGSAEDSSWFVARRVGDALRAFFTPGFSGEDRFFGIDAYPAFDPATALAIGLGTVLVAVTIRRRFHAFVLAWTTLIVLGAALLPGNLNTHRYYVALPLLYLLAALGAGVLWDWLQRPAARMALVALFAVAATAAAAANLHRLCWELIPDQRLRANWIWPRTEIIRWIRERPRDEQICVVANDDNPGITGANPLRPEWIWLLEGWTVRSSPTVEGCLPSDGNREPARYIVFTLPQAPDDLPALLRRGYPTVRELPPIAVPHHRFVARTFAAPPAGLL